MIRKKSATSIYVSGRTYVTLDVTGKILKIVINPKNVEKDCKVQIYTSEKELIVDWEGDKYTVLYPRNTYIQGQKYQTQNAENVVYEKWVNCGPLTIMIDNNGIEGIVDEVKVIYEE